jgi:geranylgeranyl diphosphate synthase type II
MQINEAIVVFDEYLNSYRKKQLSSSLLAPVDYILALGGKRLRPAIVIWISQFYNGDIDDSFKAALAIEMFHNFSLVHDDIMDASPIRRGKDTVHVKWNDNTAILSGDIMLVLVYKILSELKSPKLKQALELFNYSALEVCVGQQMDIDYEDQDSISLDDYIEMIGKKTGDLLGASFALGALLADASKEDVNHFYEFGKKTGLAFQLQDDILDLFGDHSKVGKQVGGDIIANKKTCLWIRAFEKANEKQLQELNAMALETDPVLKVKIASDLFLALDVKKDSDIIKSKYQAEAFDHLNQVSLSAESKKEIENFAYDLLGREY